MEWTGGGLTRVPWMALGNIACSQKHGSWRWRRNWLQRDVCTMLSVAVPNGPELGRIAQRWRHGKRIEWAYLLEGQEHAENTPLAISFDGNKVEWTYPLEPTAVRTCTLSVSNRVSYHVK